MTQIGRVFGASAALLLLASAASAQGARPLTKCPTDSVVSGTVCMDKFEASVWRVPQGKTSLALVKKIQGGKVTLKDLQASAQQLLNPGDYGICTAEGQSCNDVFAVSLGGISPSGNATWFQAQQACNNSGKRLPTSAEWQSAVAATPDPGGDDLSTSCNTTTGTGITPAGQRSKCVSADGAFDMVGNLKEWVADWVPRSTGCGAWPSSISTTDEQCLLGASSSGSDEPGALLRGGSYLDGTAAGPFTIDGRTQPSESAPDIGFRCAR